MNRTILLAGGGLIVAVPIVVGLIGCDNNPPQSEGRVVVVNKPDTSAQKKPRLINVVAQDAPVHERTVAELTADTLGHIGLPAVVELAELLRSPRPAVRRRAAYTLGRIGPEAQEALPALAAALDDNDPDVRKAVIRALGQLGPAAGDTVPKLIEILKRQPDTEPDEETP